MHADVAFIVRGAAGEHPTFLDDRMKRRRLPQLDRVHGLNVVVGIHQDRGLAGRMQPIGVDHRVAARLADLDVLHAGRPQVGGHELGGSAAVGCMLR